MATITFTLETTDAGKTRIRHALAKQAVSVKTCGFFSLCCHNKSLCAMSYQKLARRSKTGELSPQRLRELYHKQELRILEIAKMYNVRPKYVGLLIRQYNLSIGKDKRPARKKEKPQD
jgi:intein-encoded DNA endonuclease-like protein